MWIQFLFINLNCFYINVIRYLHKRLILQERLYFKLYSHFRSYRLLYAYYVQTCSSKHHLQKTKTIRGAVYWRWPRFRSKHEPLYYYGWYNNWYLTEKRCTCLSQDRSYVLVWRHGHGRYMICIAPIYKIQQSTTVINIMEALNVTLNIKKCVHTIYSKQFQ